ncbi:hypothetical protein RO1_03780 [Roseburia intestinalis XB6B4]|uniref:Uncharacterized protein n=1 Tax=Roseburia intestinalis XB6B4 TaxID=718255 RepID=D4KUW5_9FIRM|nr:hypothetical protein RO1_03780 [Roseburia intestinalis XB6B4]
MKQNRVKNENFYTQEWGLI